MPEISEQKQNHQRLQQVNNALGSGMFVHVRKLLQNMPARTRAEREPYREFLKWCLKM